jgi:hypothetical protein
MNTLELKWKELTLGRTRHYAHNEKPNNFAMQWHVAASTLFIHVDELVVDVRLEREVDHVAVCFISWLPLAILITFEVPRPIFI